MAMSGQRAGRLEVMTVQVRGREVRYLRGEVGRGGGPTLLFMHGWALSHDSYRAALQEAWRSGLGVLAPALPGFGGTSELADGARSLAGYASWVSDFLEAVGQTEPVIVVGHSFGGGVAIRVAHDAPKRVAGLILVNSIGGSAWTDRNGVLRALVERPLWDWGLHLGADVFPLRQLHRVVPVVLRDALSNAARDPLAVWRVANLARSADLRPELEELKRRRLPVVILWGNQDRVLPQSSLAALRIALGEATVETIEGDHGWLIRDPGTFGEIITNVLAADVRFSAPTEPFDPLTEVA